MKPLAGILELDHIASVNNIYSPIIKRFKIPNTDYFTQVYKGVRLSDEARYYKNQVTDALNDSKAKLPDDFDENYPLIVHILFELNQNINKRDLDNMEKLTIDALFEYFGINDYYIYEKHTYKVIDKLGKFEYVRYKIEQSEKRFSEYIL